MAITIYGTEGGSIRTVATIAALRALPSASESLSYTLTGYYADRDAPISMLRWDPSSVATDDGIFTFKAASITTGRFVRVLENGVFDCRWGGVKVDGTVNQGVRLSAVHAACTVQGGITQLFLPAGEINIADSVTLTPGCVDVVGSGQRRTLLKGPARTSFVSSFNLGSTLETPDTAGYGARYWTQDLTLGAGTLTFPAIADVTGLVAGDWVFVRLGADPTDQGEEFSRLITQIASITPGAGTTGAITVTTPVRENIPNDIGTNVNRLTNKHDLIKITGLCRGMKIGGFAVDNVLLNNNTTVGSYWHDIHFDYTTAAFSCVQSENTVYERITADKVTGFDLGGGGAYGYYGWYFQGWGHVNTQLRDISIALLDGVNFLSSESQSRNVSATDVSLTINSLNNTATGGKCLVSGMTVGNTQGHQFTNLSLSGVGYFQFEQYATVHNLTIRGSDDGTHAQPNVSLEAGQISGRLYYKGKNYARVRQAPTMTMPLVASTTRPMPFPLKGVLRNIRIRPSTLTGVTVNQISGASTSNITGELTAGQYASPPACTLLTGTFSGGFWSDSPALSIICDATTPANQSIEVESEFWVADDSVTTEILKLVVGAGAPSADAGYVGQEYYDGTAGTKYFSIRSGGGAADWKAY